MKKNLMDYLQPGSGLTFIYVFDFFMVSIYLSFALGHLTTGQPYGGFESNMMDKKAYYFLAKVFGGLIIFFTLFCMWIYYEEEKRKYKRKKEKEKLKRANN